MTESDRWPTCPQCGALRTTFCPVCQTAGTDFLQVDPEYAPVPDERAGPAPASCGCEVDACSSNHCSDMSREESLEQPDSAASAGGVMVICPTCDEPFAPEYPSRCEWCGHRFADGYSVDVVEAESEQLNGRTIVAFLGLGGLLLALAIYFAMIF